MGRLRNKKVDIPTASCKKEEKKLPITTYRATRLVRYLIFCNITNFIIFYIYKGILCENMDFLGLLPTGHFINIGDFRKFHTFDQKTVQSVKGHLCFLSKKFDPMKFFCPVHHSSPVNAWVWVKKATDIFDVFCNGSRAFFLYMKII